MKRLSLFFAVLFSVLVLLTGCLEEEEKNTSPASAAEGGGGPALPEGKIRYYSPAEVSAPEGTVEPAEGPFFVVEYGPESELPAEIRAPSIYILFSKPVVPLQQLGVPSGSSEIMTITPPVKGVFRWYGTKLLSFDSEEEILPQREYRVAVNPSVKSLDGTKLKNFEGFTFRSEYLTIQDFFPGQERYYFDVDDIPLDKAGEIHVVFSYPVDHSTIQKYLAVMSNGESFPYTLQEPSEDLSGLTPEELQRTVLIKVRKSFDENSEVQIVLKRGARSQPDFIGTPEDEIHTFSTIKPFTYEEYDTYSWYFPRSEEGDKNPVYLYFSHPVDENSVAGQIFTDPGMDVDDHLAVWDTMVKLNNLPVKPESRFTVFLNAPIRDVYGRTLGRSEQVDVEIPPAPRYAYFPNTGTRMLEAGFDPLIVYEFQNVFDGVWNVGAISDPYTSFPPSRLGPYSFSGIPRNQRHFEFLDLSRYLNKGGKGYVGLSWNFEEKDKEGKRPSWGQNNLQLQVTDLGVTTRYGANKVIAWVTSLSSGLPVAGARVALLHNHDLLMNGITDEDGLAVFPIPRGEYGSLFRDSDSYWRDNLRIEVVSGDDKIEFKPNFSHNQWHFGVYNYWSPVEIEKPRMDVFMFTDRGLYKPGETVTFRGIDRTWYMGEHDSYTGSYTVEVRENRYEGEIIRTLEGQATDSGGFYGSFILPEEIQPGYYEIGYRRPGGSAAINFQVAQFQRVTFNVYIQAPEKTYFLGDTLDFSVSASYLAGGTITRGEYEYYWMKEPVRFAPPGDEWKPYVFGPDRWDGRINLSSKSDPLSGDGTVKAVQQTTAEGIAGMAYTYSLEALVSDQSRRQVAARSSAVVHPASYYIGTRLDAGTEGYFSRFVEKGTELPVSFTFVDTEGSPVKRRNLPDELTAELIHVEWQLSQQQGVSDYITTRYERVEELEKEQTVKKPGAEGEFSIQPESSGSYILRLSSADLQGRRVVTELSFYATGSDWVRWGLDDPGDIGLEPNKKEYSPGETASILLKSPLPKGTYLLTLEREGILDEQILSIEGSTSVVEIPIKEEYTPVVYVSLCSYTVRTKKAETDYFEPDLDKPKGLFGIVPLYVDPVARRIDLELSADRQTYLPGDTVTVTITATRQGDPVEGAEITYLAVDRGVLDLIDYHVSDPLHFFYSPSRFPLGVAGADSRSLLIDPVTYSVRDLHGGDAEEAKMGEETAASADTDVRRDFNPTAVFKPFLKTDTSGRATFTYTLPDTLTAYRCTVLAVDENRYGFLEDELKVQNPINLLVSMPATLRLRDTAEGMVMLTNLTKKNQKVDISLEADGIEFEGNTEAGVNLKAGETEAVPFYCAATTPGEAEVRISISSDVLTERLVRRVKVEKPLVFESFSTIGETGEEGTGEEGIIIPGTAEKGEGSITLTMDATRLSTIAEAVSYVYWYPYGCLEQRTSKLLPLILFQDHFDAFSIDPGIEDVDELIREELDFLALQQRSDGGFPFWPGAGSVSSYYVSARMAHILALASDRGIGAPEKINLPSLLNYLRRPGHGEMDTPFLLLYGLYVRSLHGENIVSEGARLFNREDELGVSGYALLGLSFLNNGADVWAKRVQSKVKRFFKPGTRTIDLTDTYESARFYNSRIEQLSLLFMLYNGLEGGGEMETRILNTLLSFQKGGKWRNTAENFWAIQAYAQSIDSSSLEQTEFTGRAAVNNTEVAESRFSGAGAGTEVTVLPFNAHPLNTFPRDTLLKLSFEKEGQGNLYYSATLKYALPAELLYPRDEGIGIYTEISDMAGRKISGTRLKAGSTYLMKAHIVSSRHRQFVAARVPVPSGAEILDASFTTTPKYYSRKQSDDDYFRVPPVQILLGNEVRYIWDDFPPGVKEVEYLFRVTSRGIFPTPPAVAECMYEPEVFGRDEGRLFILE